MSYVVYPPTLTLGLQFLKLLLNGLNAWNTLVTLTSLLDYETRISFVTLHLRCRGSSCFVSLQG